MSLEVTNTMDENDVDISHDDMAWVREFEAEHKRPPKVLHIGNIANNAYLNAKILRRAGLDCHVLCYDYYHIMGAPEWEDADLEGDWGSDFYPKWSSVNTTGYARPYWYVQGPLFLCEKYLSSLANDHAFSVRLYSGLIKLHNVAISRAVIRSLLRGIKSLYILLRVCYSYLKKISSGVKFGLQHFIKYLESLEKKHNLAPVCNKIISLSKMFLEKIISFRVKTKTTHELGFKDTRRRLIQEFEKSFPGRPDKLTNDDLNKYRTNDSMWSNLLSEYDLVHGYATDGIYPLIVGKRYIAYEHGTIRNIPFNDSTQGRLCALTYKLANQAIITNCDNIEAATNLHMDNYSFVPHPVNEDHMVIDDKTLELESELRSKTKSDFIVFHPPRQHWESARHPDWEKGNDIFIRGFAKFVNEVNNNAAAVFVDWGKSVTDSKILLEELGVSDRVLWIRPQPNISMLRYINATDLLADQFYLGAFGSTMPKALACGKPAMLYLNEKIHEWCFPEMPPIINAKVEEDVFQGLKKLYLDSEWKKKIEADSLSWYEKYHSNERIRKSLLSVYKEALS